MSKLYIKNFNYIRECGVFHDWPAGHVTFGRYNLIYGWNGSGKTTLSRILRSLEKGAVDPSLQSEEATPSFQLKLLDDSTADSGNLTGFQVKIRVFNCDFIRENINADLAEALPVYHLGKEQGDALEKLSKVREQLERNVKLLAELEKRQTDITTTKEAALTTHAGVIRDAISDHRFDRAKLRPLLEDFRKQGTDTAPLIIDETKFPEVLNTATDTNDKNKIDLLAFTPSKTVGIIHAAAQKLCATSVTKATIDDLDANEDLRDWVEAGVSLHKGKKTCAFCNSNIREDRVTLLNRYFNEAYNNLMNGISAEKQALKTLVTEIKAIRISDRGLVYPNLRASYSTHVKALENAKASFVAICEEIDASLTTKQGSLTESVPLPDLNVVNEKASAFGDALDKLNQTINSHNEQFDNFEEEVKSAKRKIIDHYSASHFSSYLASMNSLEEIGKEITPLLESVDKLKVEEAQLDSKLREHDIAVDRINELLASFNGRVDIKLVTSEKGYHIEREGVRANNLSEGEKTAIAFTYFIAKMEEKDFDVQESVIVIDDPISSLDTNALYAAGSFIRCHLGNASQLFVLTHNYHFFWEIFGWIKGIRTPDGSDWQESLPYKSYIILKCEVNAHGKREAKPQKLDNTLKNFDSEYVFLFKQLYESKGRIVFAEDAAAEEILRLALLPNVARRVLETFIMFKFPDKADGEISGLFYTIKKLGVDFPVEKTSVLDRLLNRISHGTMEGMGSINMFDISETPKAIQYALDFIELADRLHFDGLKRAAGVREPARANDNQPEVTPATLAE